MWIHVNLILIKKNLSFSTTNPQSQMTFVTLDTAYQPVVKQRHPRRGSHRARPSVCHSLSASEMHLRHVSFTSQNLRVWVDQNSVVHSSADIQGVESEAEVTTNVGQKVSLVCVAGEKFGEQNFLNYC